MSYQRLPGSNVTSSGTSLAPCFLSPFLVGSLRWEPNQKAFCWWGFTINSPPSGQSWPCTRQDRQAGCLRWSSPLLRWAWLHIQAAVRSAENQVDPWEGHVISTILREKRTHRTCCQLYGMPEPHSPDALPSRLLKLPPGFWSRQKAILSSNSTTSGRNQFSSLV